MDTSKTDLKSEIREITIAKSGVHASLAGPKQLPIVRLDQEPDAAPYVKTTGGFRYAKWGRNNRYPQEVVDLNNQDTTSAACLAFKIKAHYGLGLQLYKKSFENGQEVKVPVSLSDYPEIEEFFWKSDMENYLQSIATDFEWWNWAVTELIPTGDGKKIYAINRIPVVNTRMGIIDPRGKINEVHVSPDFPFSGGEVVTTKPIKIFDRLGYYDPRNTSKRIEKSVYIHRQTSVDRTYYPLPAWHSNNKWLNTSLEISDWILSNLNNSINLKYHIEYPQEYFEMLCPADQYDTEAERLAAMKAEKDTLFKSIDEYLAGTQNVGKFIHTYTVRHQQDPTQELSFKIKVMENKTNHEAYLPAFDTSAAAIANAHNAPLDLVGLSLSKGMGAGSGSNIRESFNYYMQLHVVIPRQTTLEALNLVKKINRWPEDVHFGFRNIVFQSVNENKSGYAVENESNPTSANK
jgi:hypothetical protein